MFHQYHQQNGGRVEKRKEPGSTERQPGSLCGWVGFKACLTHSADMGYGPIDDESDFIKATARKMS